MTQGQPQGIDLTRIVTPVAILSFPHLWTVWRGKKGEQDPKYGATFIFPKGTDLTPLLQAALQALKEEFDDVENRVKTGELHLPFRKDGARYGYPEGSIFIGASRHERFGAPSCVSRYRDPATNKAHIITQAEQVTGNPNELYPGCKVKGLLSCYAYNNVRKGVSFGLNGVQKWEDGERLDNRVAAEEVFEADLAEQPASLVDVQPAGGVDLNSLL